MWFRVLGTLEVRSGSHRLIRIGAAKQRTLLAVLLLNVNRPVHADRLVDALWPQRPPRTAAVALRTYVSALRQVLGLADRADPPLLSTVPGGYQLHISPSHLDLLTFEELAAQGRQALTDGRPGLAAERLRRALGLWRGRPFEDVPLDPRLGTELIRLEERRLAAQETWIDSQLALGHHGDLLAELGALVAEQPLRERLQAQWMLALYRSGRQAEALRAYRDLRRQLVQELGVEPSPPLQRLHRQILAGHADLTPPAGATGATGAQPGAPVVPRQLPRDIGGFIGRAAELARLSALAHPGERSGAPVIGTIDGMAAVGKTALAVHAAHRLADRFADGQLFIDLHGFTQGMPPVDPADALGRMLGALGVPGEQIPPDLDARAALYRTRLAGRRVLILLDNAAEESQVRPLLPGAPGCLTLITSRRRLAGLEDVRRLSLDVLPRDEALALFTRTAGERRLAGQPAGPLTEIVELCGRLPLAIRVAAARLRSRPGWTPAHLADRLRDRQHRLGELEVDRLSVTTAMDLSYHRLGSDLQGMYRLLGLHPGPDIERHAAAALAGTTLQHADRLLDDLVDAHLLQEPVSGRYRFHDLLRAHATATLADEDTEIDRRTALTRLFDHYVSAVPAAAEPAHPGAADHVPRVRRPVGPVPLPGGPARGAEWLDAELANLLAAAAHAAGHGWPVHARRLAVVLQRHLHTRAHHARVPHAALAPVGADRDRELAALCGLGDVHLAQGRSGEAAECFEQALEIARAVIGRGGGPDAPRAHARPAPGRSAEYSDYPDYPAYSEYSDYPDYPAYSEYSEYALEIARATGDRDGELRALTGLGFVHLLRGEYRTAADHYRRALKIARRVGDRGAQFEGLYGLARAHQATGHPAKALVYHQAALDIARDSGHPADQARSQPGPRAPRVRNASTSRPRPRATLPGRSEWF
ncbi:BTAD domain-containing putative transcriptional regulator [Streptosporangium fragile]|uniref:BTAD domain-containing putative transcriptional regulator n=1 Tax=Streptosporangium fragile TaxID=46186 RepID=A0ABN3W7B1_9ACTN